MLKSIEVWSGPPFVLQAAFAVIPNSSLGCNILWVLHVKQKMLAQKNKTKKTRRLIQEKGSCIFSQIENKKEK